MSTKQHPQRTCAVCRTKKDKRDLTRLVLAEAGLCVDSKGKMDGRGAYLCGNPDCWERAASQSFLANALHAELSNVDRIYLRQMIPS